MKQISKGFIRTSFSLAALFAGASAASAQTSGSLTGTVTSTTANPTYNYSTAPWVITGGAGLYPDGSGVATFNPVTSAFPGTLPTFSAVVLDVSPTLSQIVYNTPFYYNVVAGAGSLVASNLGLTVNAQSSAQNITLSTGPISAPVGFAISSPISGGGSAGLTKTGSGNFFLSPTAANTYTGGTHFNGGFTSIVSTAAIGDAVFGAAGPGNGLSFNGGTAFFNTTGGLTTGRDVFIDAGGGTINTNTATSLGGVVSGAGLLTLNALNASTLTFTGANTHTGAIVSRGVNVSAILAGAGSFTASSSYDLTGAFTLNNTGTNVADRLSNTAAMTLRGINFISNGNASAASSETIGAVTAANGFSTFLVTPGATAANSLTIASLTRANNATLDFRGTGLGGAPGAGVSNIYVNAAPTLVGGGGGAGTTGISILPYAIGNSTNSTSFTTTGQVASSFVTNDVNGIRPLAVAEYATAFGGSPTNNVRLTDVTAAGSGVTVNSLLVAPAAGGGGTPSAALLTGGTINVTSGAVLYSPTANANGYISADLNFGGAEGVLTNTSLLTMSGAISGSGGLTLTTAYPPTNSYMPTLTLSGVNTYTGNTTINAGVVGFAGTIANATAGAFGTSGTVILNAGNSVASLAPTGATTFNRDISVIGLGQNYIAPAASGYTATFNGNISLSSNLLVFGYSNTAVNAVTFNGVISGPGAIRDAGGTYGVINGNNTYSGGTVIAAGSSYFAGSDTAFGTGTLTFGGAASLAGVGVTARTIANPVFLNAVNATFGGTAPLTFTGGLNLNGSSAITVSNTALTTFGGAVSSGAITKFGAGAVAFNSPTGSTYTGGTILGANVGTIYGNNASGSAFGAGAVSVGGTSQTVFSTLAGNFTASGAVALGGRLSPGNGPGLTAATAGQGSIGTANFGSSLTLTSTAASSLYLEIGSSTSRDTVNVAGTLTLAGTVYFATTGGYVVQLGNTFDFVDAAATVVNGTLTFNSANVTFAPGVGFDTSTFATNGTVTAIAVPEPGTVSLLGAGLLAAAGFIRRRRR